MSYPLHSLQVPLEGWVMRNYYVLLGELTFKIKFFKLKQKKILKLNIFAKHFSLDSLTVAWRK